MFVGAPPRFPLAAALPATYGFAGDAGDAWAAAVPGFAPLGELLGGGPATGSAGLSCVQALLPGLGGGGAGGPGGGGGGGLVVVVILPPMPPPPPPPPPPVPPLAPPPGPPPPLPAQYIGSTVVRSTTRLSSLSVFGTGDTAFDLGPVRTAFAAAAGSNITSVTVNVQDVIFDTTLTLSGGAASGGVEDLGVVQTEAVLSKAQQLMQIGITVLDQANSRQQVVMTLFRRGRGRTLLDTTLRVSVSGLGSGDGRLRPPQQPLRRCRRRPAWPPSQTRRTQRPQACRRLSWARCWTWRLCALTRETQPASAPRLHPGPPLQPRSPPRACWAPQWTSQRRR
jgi:hypothetical protein